ncbi:MAG: ABC transporter substrate-binding protein [Oscillospiraceae bacterium]|nr:ABC transporter substrate-binding protein [Oscillospiraceae bacterium]
MQRKNLKALLMIIISVALVLAACTPAATPPVAPPAAGDAPAGDAPAGDAPAATGEPILFGHLAYHTGGFGFHGPQFDASVNLAIREANQDPPLGRPISPAWHVDVGTLGEGDAARQLVDAHGVHILYNTAGQYITYRQWILQHVADNDGPLMPSIHGGAVPDKYGGTPLEPLMRGEPQTSEMAMAMLLDFYDMGGRSVVIVASDREEMMQQRAYTIEAAELLGIEVLDVIVIQPGETSYRAEASRVVMHDPDGVIQFSHAGCSGIFLSNATELGASDMLWYVETNSAFQPFVDAATIDAINAQRTVRWPTIAVQDNPAWHHFSALWYDFWDPRPDEPAHNYYVTSSWDILMLTFLAIEKAGSLYASDWVPAMYAIAAPGGEIVHTYLDGIAALRAGREIQYVGVVGTLDFSSTGTINMDWVVGSWNPDGTPNYDGNVITRQRQNEIISQLTTEWSWD